MHEFHAKINNKKVSSWRKMWKKWMSRDKNWKLKKVERNQKFKKIRWNKFCGWQKLCKNLLE